MIDNASIVTFVVLQRQTVVLEHHYGAIYPHCKLIDEVSFFGFQRIVYVKIGNVLGSVFAENTFFTLYILQ